MKVTDVWESEPRGFTPWLAAPDNLKLLCEIVDLGELVDVKQEEAVGRFRVDILARDQQDGVVIIENQFGFTDHGHLGQIMTYLAGQKGKATVIWIAEDFRDEHRAVIDWLNANTGPEYAFFAAELEVLRIGNSEPAPWFNIVAKPNDWSRVVRADSSLANNKELTARQKIQLSFWDAFSQFLKSQNSDFRIRRANKDHWFEFPTGRSGSVISVTISTERYKRIGVEIYNHGDASKFVFDSLSKDKSAIESEIGQTLDWQRLDGKKATRIVLFNNEEDPSNPERWSYQHTWLLNHMKKFKLAFAKRLRTIPTAEEVVNGSEAPVESEP